MSPFATFWRVIVPQVTPAAAPSIVNQFTVSVKSSTLVSAITVRDLMFRSQKIVNIWSEPIYIALIFPVSIAGKTLADSLRSRYGIAPA
jgi:ABC-type amino acid transport system permease subunit